MAHFEMQTAAIFFGLWFGWIPDKHLGRKLPSQWIYVAADFTVFPSIKAFVAVFI